MCQSTKTINMMHTSTELAYTTEAIHPPLIPSAPVEANTQIIGAQILDLKIKEPVLSVAKIFDKNYPEVIAVKHHDVDTPSISDDPHGHVPGNISDAENKSSLVDSTSKPSRKQELALPPNIFNHNPEDKAKLNGHQGSSNTNNLIPLKYDKPVANAIVHGSPAASNSEPHEEDLQALPVNINHDVKHKLNYQKAQNPSTRKNKNEHWWHRQRRMWRKRNNYMKRNGKAFEKRINGFSNKNTIEKGVKRNIEMNSLSWKSEEELQEMHRGHNRNPPAGVPKHHHLVNRKGIQNNSQNPKKRMQPQMHLGEHMPFWRKGDRMNRPNHKLYSNEGMPAHRKQKFEQQKRRYAKIANSMNIEDWHVQNRGHKKIIQNKQAKMKNSFPRNQEMSNPSIWEKKKMKMMEHVLQRP